MKELNLFILLLILQSTIRSNDAQNKTDNITVTSRPISSTPVPVDEGVCSEGFKCVPPIQCPINVLDDIKPTFCHIKSERTRVCCKPQPNITDSSDVRARGSGGKRVVHIPNKLLSQCLRKAEMDSHDLLKNLRILNHDKHSQLPAGTPSFTHSKNSRFQNQNEMKEMLKISDDAHKLVTASQEVKKKARFGNNVYERGLIRHESLRGHHSINCHDSPKCQLPSSRYRSLDGTCNNPRNGGWGAGRTPYTRLLPPLYDDGVFVPRKSFHNEPLPSTRLISSALFTDENRPDYYHTQMLMTFGQFVSHDITHSIPTKQNDGSPINCCPQEDAHHPFCLPIFVSHRDPFFSEYNVSCINFVRSLLAPNDGCNLGYAEQMNKVSHFLDGSVIYGTSAEILYELREHEGGRLKMFLDFGRELLPLSKNGEECLMMEHGYACFSSGDSRTNQMVTLSALHLLFAREHNRICRKLEKLNRHWDDEKLFLEARKIVIGELQHIVYSQWLPEIIGREAMHEFELEVDYPGYSNNYDPYVNPSITNEFATAAFRFGHSIVDGKLKMYGRHRMEEIIDIPEVMFSPGRLRMKYFFDELLSTLTLDPIQMADAHVSSALTRYMFRGGNPFGMDLISINIQRGRDHGLRTYNDYRELVGLPRYHYFEDFGHKAGDILKYIYKSVDDVDVYVGALLEPPSKGGIVGITFRDMIADQFYRIKKGDRFFYNLNPIINPGHFTPAQLYEIKKSSLSRIICDNSDHYLLYRQAINPFRRPGAYGNRVIDCDREGYDGIPKINFAPWEDIH